MSWKKGQSGNPIGRQSEKPFLDALKIALKEPAEDGRPKLRKIAQQLVSAAVLGKDWAIQQVADRLDGKPAQESNINVNHKHDATDWTRSELVALLHDARKGSNGAATADGCSGESDSVH